MKQQINLFLALPKKETIKLPSSLVFKILGIFSAVLLFVFICMFVYKWYLQVSLSKLETNRNSASLRLAQLAKEYPSVAIMATKEATLQKEIKNKAALVKILREQMFINERGFSEYMESLAKQIVEGVWLTKIAIEDGGRLIVLTGQALTHKSITKFVDNLNADPIFAKREFKLSQIGKDQEKQAGLNFTLRIQEGDVA
jgi:Tfp pilus assembly protein PilN